MLDVIIHTQINRPDHRSYAVYDIFHKRNYNRIRGKSQFR